MREWMRTCIRLALTIAALQINLSAQKPRYDLLLKGGHMIDPANGIDAMMDVAVAAGKIAAVEKDIAPSEAGKVVDASRSHRYSLPHRPWRSAAQLVCP